MQKSWPGLALEVAKQAAIRASPWHFRVGTFSKFSKKHLALAPRRRPPHFPENSNCHGSGEYALTSKHFTVRSFPLFFSSPHHPWHFHKGGRKNLKKILRGLYTCRKYIPAFEGKHKDSQCVRHFTRSYYMDLYGASVARRTRTTRPERDVQLSACAVRETTARSQRWRGSGEVDPSSFSSIPCGHNIGYSGRCCQLTATDTVGG